MYWVRGEAKWPIDARDVTMDPNLQYITTRENGAVNDIKRPEEVFQKYR